MKRMVRVKDGVFAPRKEPNITDMSGWVGEYLQSILQANKQLVMIFFTDEIVKKMPQEYIDYCQENDLDKRYMCLHESKVDIIKKEENKLSRFETFKNMTIEQMADYIVEHSKCECDYCSVSDGNQVCDDTKCRDKVIEWLNNPIE